MRDWDDLTDWEKKPETLMDRKAEMAVTCAWLNMAITALGQSCFGMRCKEMDAFRQKVEDMRWDLKQMVKDIIKEQAQVRRHFQVSIGEEPDEMEGEE